MSPRTLANAGVASPTARPAAPGDLQRLRPRARRCGHWPAPRAPRCFPAAAPCRRPRACRPVAAPSGQCLRSPARRARFLRGGHVEEGRDHGRAQIGAGRAQVGLRDVARQSGGLDARAALAAGLDRHAERGGGRARCLAPIVHADVDAGIGQQARLLQFAFGRGGFALRPAGDCVRRLWTGPVPASAARWRGWIAGGRNGGRRRRRNEAGGWLGRRGQQGGRQGQRYQGWAHDSVREGSGGPAQPGWDRHLAALYRTGLVRTPTEK